MLHLVFQSSDAVLARIGDDDELIFLNNAVLALLKKGVHNSTLIQLLKTQTLYALAEDLQVRGIAPEELVTGICCIDYSTFVALTVKHLVIQSWT